MTCRECGASIAAKAIVCYKCGTPTAEGPEVSRTPAAGVQPRTVVVLLAFVAVVTALAAWLIPKTPDGTWMRWAAWAAVPVSVFVGARLLRGPRSSRLRRR